MAEHKDLLDTTAHCHTPQGFAAASNDTVMTKNSTGALTWETKTVIGGEILTTNPHGHSYISSTSATTVTTGGTYYKVAGTWTNTEASSVTWSTDHFIISTAGAYVVYLVGDALIVNGSTLALDINREATIASGNVQGYVPYRMNNPHASAAKNLGVSATFYLDDLEVSDKITPMVSHASGDDGTAVTCTLQMFLWLQHT